MRMMVGVSVGVEVGVAVGGGVAVGSGVAVGDGVGVGNGVAVGTNGVGVGTTESVWGSEMASESLKRPLSVWIGV